LLNPILRASVYYFAFSYIRNERFDNFIVYLFGGIIIWSFFTEATSKSIKILQQKKYLIENIRFNWEDIMFANVLSVLLGFMFNFIAYLLLVALHGILPNANFFLLPIFFANLALIPSCLLHRLEISFAVNWYSGDF